MAQRVELMAQREELVETSHPVEVLKLLTLLLQI